MSILKHEYTQTRVLNARTRLSLTFVTAVTRTSTIKRLVEINVYVHPSARGRHAAKPRSQVGQRVFTSIPNLSIYGLDRKPYARAAAMTFVTIQFYLFYIFLPARVVAR